MTGLWRVGGGPPIARTYASKLAARRLMRRYARLGIQASLYASTNNGDTWKLIERRNAQGQPYRVPNDPEADRELN